MFTEHLSGLGIEMPNRILKESICTSDNLDALSTPAEVFFYRLLVQCDDYGRMHARPAILRARCFPLRLDTVENRHIEMWLAELVAAKLIAIYENDGIYLQVLKWDKHQQIRAKSSKFPQMQESDIVCNQLISDDDICPRIRESYSESNTNAYSESEAKGATIVAAVAPDPPKKPRKVKEPDTTPKLKDDPRIRAYHDLNNLWPSTAQMQIIIERDPPLPEFIRAMRSWAERGYNPRNLKGILEWVTVPPVERNGSGNGMPVSKSQRTMDMIDGVFDQLRAAQVDTEFDVDVEITR